MIQSLNPRGVCCNNNCRVKSLTPHHAYGYVCIHNDKRKCQCKVRHAKPCPANNICGKIYDEIVKEHAHNDPIWQNTTASLWAINHWEYAKCFLGSSGYTNKNSASETDVPGLLSICMNCNTIRATINVNQFDKVRNLRHDIMHAASLELSSTDMQNILLEIETLLQQQPFVNNSDAQAAITNIKALPDIMHSSVPLTKVEEFKQLRYETLRVLKEIHRSMVRAGKLTKGASILANGVTVAAGLVCLYLLITAPPAAAPTADATFDVGRRVALGTDIVEWFVDKYYLHEIRRCIQKDKETTNGLLRQLQQFERELTVEENNNVKTLMSSIDVGLLAPKEVLSFVNPKSLAMELPKLKAVINDVRKMANALQSRFAKYTPGKLAEHNNCRSMTNNNEPGPLFGQTSSTNSDSLEPSVRVSPKVTNKGAIASTHPGTVKYTAKTGSLYQSDKATDMSTKCQTDQARATVAKKGKWSEATMTVCTVAICGYNVYTDGKHLYNGYTSDEATKLEDVIADIENHIKMY